MDLKHWLHGLVATVINGATSGALLMVVDPANFNLAEGRNKLLGVALAFGLQAALNYLKQSPLPALKAEATPDNRYLGV